MLAEASYKLTEGFLNMDVSALPGVKQNIRRLKKEEAEILSSSRDGTKLKKIKRKIKLLKRETRLLSKQKKNLAAAAAAEATVKARAEQAAAASAAPAEKAAEQKK
jgi:ABC-type Na+ transport system ATPase subunit NatA